MKIAFVCLPLQGHLNPMAALAAALQTLGHHAVLFSLPEAGVDARAAGLDFVPIGADVYPEGSVERIWGPVRRLCGMDIMRYAGERIQPALLAHALRELPRAFQDQGIEAAVFDTAYAFAELAAIQVGIPYAQAWLVLNFDPTGTTPPCTFDGSPDSTETRQGENLREVSDTFAAFFAPSLPVVRSFVEQSGLPIGLGDPGATASRLAIVSQVPQEFDFPGIPWPPQFRYSGPFSPGRKRLSPPFPWGRLTEAPLIYASLGTVVNGALQVYRAILGVAVRMEEHQFVLSIGSGVAIDDLGPVPSNAVIVTTAPQLELLARAVLCITHAGLNTVLECLAAGVPMVAIPIGYDQPGVAARIAHHGVGESIPMGQVSEDVLLRSATKVIHDRRYRDRACWFKEVVRRNDGLTEAAQFIEASLASAIKLTQFHPT